VDPSLNIVWFVFHTAWMVFNSVGWAWRSTRRWHLITVALTVLSWFGLGIFYGWGYCPCTEWHWRVRRRLGFLDDPPSYIQLLVGEISGFEPSVELANAAAVLVLTVATALSVALTVRDVRQARERSLRCPSPWSVQSRR
jgi:hypothetical protein